MGRLALVAFLLQSAAALAQAPEGEIEMEGDPPADAPPDAPAEPPADVPPTPVKDPKVARKWLRAAQQLVAKGDALVRQNKLEDARIQYENAVTAYQKSIEAGDDVAVYYDLAVAEDKAGRTPEAMIHLKAVIGAQGIKPDVVKKAQAKLDEFSMKVGFVALSITPDGTQVSIAGKPIGEAPLSEPLVLVPGTHVVSLTAVGFQPKDVELKVEAGSESERKIALEPVPMGQQRPDPGDEPMPEAPPPPTGPSRTVLYIGGAATIALAATATVTGILAMGEHGTFTDPAVSAGARADAQAAGKRLALVTDLCILGALGAAGFTAYYYVYQFRPQQQAFGEMQQARHRPKVEVVPWVQSSAGGVVVGGSF